MHRNITVSHHAIDRYRERVDPAATKHEAAARLRSLAATGRARSRPRHWTRVAGEQCGCRYVYSAEAPGVCLVVTNGTVVTVFSRATCARWRSERAISTAAPRPARRPRYRPARGAS